MMRRILTLIVITVLFGCGVAFAQESAPGAGRVELNISPAGGIFFAKSSGNLQPSFGDYALSTGLTLNLSRFVGIEGEIGGGLGMRQNLDFNQGVVRDVKTPHILAYNGNLVLYPGGNDRAVVPYLTGGAGRLTLMKPDFTSADRLDLTDDVSFTTVNGGAGLKWFAGPHWGVRGDYRLLYVQQQKDAPAFFGRDDDRIGHRVTVGFIVTGGR